MEISESQARLIRDCVTETVLRRQHLGAPIPQRVRDLLAYVSSSGHQGVSCGTESTQDPDDLIDTETAAEILGCTRRHARRLVADLDGQSIAGRWVFSRSAVEEYAEAKGATDARQHRSGPPRRDSAVA
jgi:hypothetical protein